MTFVINGTTGATQSASFDSASTFGFKNRIINGDMRIAQRGALVLSSNGATYGGPDRFFLSVGGFSTVSVIALQTASVFSGSAYCYQVGNLTTTGGAGSLAVIQRIEAANTFDLNSQAVTITLKVKQATGSALNAQIALRKPSATDNFSTVSLIAASTPVSVPDSTVTTLTFTTTLGASDASNGLQVEVYFPTVPATTNKQIYVGEWQLEKGSTATSFDYRPYGTELALCQRYCINYNSANANGAFYRYCYGECTTAIGFQAQIQLPVTMRTTPSVTTTGTAANYAVYSRATVTALNAAPTIGGTDCSPQTVMMNTTVASGLTAGSAGALLSNNNQTSYLLFSAEL